MPTAPSALSPPQGLVRQLARRGGLSAAGDGVRWRGDRRHTLAPRLRWIAAAQRASSGAQLALLLRQLESALDWDGCRRPGSGLGAWAEAVVRGKRRAPLGVPGHELLVGIPQEGAPPDDVTGECCPPHCTPAHASLLGFCPGSLDQGRTARHRA